VLSGLRWQGIADTQVTSEVLLGADASRLGSIATLDRKQGLLTFRLSEDLLADVECFVYITIKNPWEPQEGERIELQTLDPLAMTLREETDTGLDRAKPLLIIDFVVANISQSSAISGGVNTLTVTFSVSGTLTYNVTDMLVVQVVGLVKTNTPDTKDFTAYSSYNKNTPIHSATWHGSSGGLYLRLNGPLVQGRLYSFSFDIQNGNMAQGQANPSVSIGKLLEAWEFTSDQLLPAVVMSSGEGAAAPLKVFADLTGIRIGQNTASAGAANTLSLTLTSRFGLTVDKAIQLTLLGLTGSSTPSGLLDVRSKIVQESSGKERILSDFHAAWNRERGSLTYTFAQNVTVLNTEYIVLWFSLTNPIKPQPSPVVQLWLSQLYPSWLEVNNAEGLSAPLAVAGILSAFMYQSCDSQDEDNVLSVHFMLQTSVSTQSFIDVSGLTGTATASGPLDLNVSVVRDPDGTSQQLQQSKFLQQSDSPFYLTGSWNQSLGRLRVLIHNAPQPLANYTISWIVRNSPRQQVTPADIEMSGGGEVSMSAMRPQLAAGSASPLNVNGLSLATLAQSEASVSSINILTLSLITTSALLRGTFVTLTGLAGAAPTACIIPNPDNVYSIQTPTECDFPVEVWPKEGTWSERATWRELTDGHKLMVLQVLQDTRPGIRYSFAVELLNGPSAQRSPDISISACCASRLVAGAIERASSSDATTPLLIAGSAVAGMSQSSAAQGAQNTLTFSFSFNVRLQVLSLLALLVHKYKY
jgi:hypothetical protein